MSELAARTVRLIPRAALALPARVRRGLAAALALTVLLVAAWFGWFRDSSLVAVEKVEVTGLTAPGGDRIEAALVAAGRDMTTLHVRRDDLERVVAGFPVVRSVEASADFPHSLAIHIVERRPVALLVTGARRLPVAGDGTLLPDVRVRGSLPSIRVESTTSGARLDDPEALAVVAVAAAAPPRLRERIERIDATSDRGLVAYVEDGPDVVIGDSRRLRAKWIAATRVLAEQSSQGASYVDVRIPERPAAGGLDFEITDPDTPPAVPPAQPQQLPQAQPAQPQPAPGAQAGPAPDAAAPSG